MFTDKIDLVKPEGHKIKSFNELLSGYILDYLNRNGLISSEIIDIPKTVELSKYYKTYALSFDDWGHLNLMVEFFCNSLAFQIKKEVASPGANNKIRWRRYPYLDIELSENNKKDKFYISCRCTVEREENNNELSAVIAHNSAIQ